MKTINVNANELKTGSDRAFEELTVGIRLGTFLVDPLFFEIAKIDPGDTELTISNEYQFNNKSEFIALLKSSDKKDLALLLSESNYSREIFHIPKDFYKENAYLYNDSEAEDGLLFTENTERFYLTGHTNNEK